MFWYGLLIVVLLVVPGVLGEFYVGELGGVFIFAIAGVGLMLLTGYTGLVNLGQAAFLGIGAYTNAVLMTKGVPFIITLPLAGLVCRACRRAARGPDDADDGLLSRDRDARLRLDRRHRLPEMDLGHRRLRRFRRADAVDLRLRRSKARPASTTCRWRC